MKVLNFVIALRVVNKDFPPQHMIEHNLSYKNLLMYSKLFLTPSALQCGYPSKLRKKTTISSNYFLSLWIFVNKKVHHVASC
jgi:hypothetical protein